MKIEIKNGFEGAKKELYDKAVAEKTRLANTKTEYECPISCIVIIGILFFMLRCVCPGLVEYVVSVCVAIGFFTICCLWTDKQEKNKRQDNLQAILALSYNKYLNSLEEESCLEEEFCDEIDYYKIRYQYWDLLQFKEAMSHNAEIEPAFVHSPDSDMNGSYAFVYRDQNKDLHMMGFYSDVICDGCEKGEDKLVWDDGKIIHYSYDMTILAKAFQKSEVE